MRGEITTWSDLLASGLVATEATLVLFTPYALIAPGDEDTLTHGDSDHIMFYGGPSVLRQELPPGRNLTRVKLVTGELIVPTVRLIQKSLVVPRSAIALGLIAPDKTNNPLGRKREYACVRTSSLANIRLARGLPQQRRPAEDEAKEVQAV